jgi:HEPN domain-containing protein
MQPSALEEAREWLARADEDLAAAERVLQTPPPLLATAAYHAQQAGEKALKAFLAAHDVPFRPTHSLEELLSQCQAIDASFGQLSLAARTLTPYATRFRYPGGPLAPTSVEAEDALQLADDAVQFVRVRLGL